MARTYTLPPTYSHKQGDTFDWTGYAVRTENGVDYKDFTDWTGNCELRKSDGTLAGSLIFSWTDAATGVFNLSMSSLLTGQLDTGNYKYDVEFTSLEGVVISTPTVKLIIVEEVTL